MTRPSETRSRPRNWARATLQGFLRYGGSAVVLILLFHFLPGRHVWHVLRSLPVQLWLLVLSGYLVAQCIGVGKWRLGVNLVGVGLDARQAACCYFAGLFGSLFLPSFVGGDLVRAV